jgi:hypothetical protein
MGHGTSLNNNSPELSLFSESKYNVAERNAFRCGDHRRWLATSAGGQGIKTKSRAMAEISVVS